MLDAKALVDKVKNGSLELGNVQLAAHLDHEMSKEALLALDAPLANVSYLPRMHSVDDFKWWLMELRHGGSDTMLRAGVACARFVLPLWTSEIPLGNGPSDFVRAVDTWVECQCADHRGTVDVARRGLPDPNRTPFTDGSYSHSATGALRVLWGLVRLVEAVSAYEVDPREVVSCLVYTAESAAFAALQKEKADCRDKVKQCIQDELIPWLLGGSSSSSIRRQSKSVCCSVSSEASRAIGTLLSERLIAPHHAQWISECLLSFNCRCVTVLWVHNCYTKSPGISLWLVPGDKREGFSIPQDHGKETIVHGENCMKIFGPCRDVGLIRELAEGLTRAFAFLGFTVYSDETADD